MKDEVILKKTVFGGFNCRQVTEYINNLSMQAEKDKTDAKELEELKDKISELRFQIKERNNEIEKLNGILEESQKDNQFSRVSSAFIKEMVNYAESYIDSVKFLAKDIDEKTGIKVESAKAKIKAIMDTLNDVSEYVSDLYKSVESLKEDYDDFSGAYNNEFIDEMMSDLAEQEHEPQRDIFSCSEPEPEPEMHREDDMDELMRRFDAKYDMLNNNGI